MLHRAADVLPLNGLIRRLTDELPASRHRRRVFKNTNMIRGRSFRVPTADLKYCPHDAMEDREGVSRNRPLRSNLPDPAGSLVQFGLPDAVPIQPVDAD